MNDNIDFIEDDEVEYYSARDILDGLMQKLELKKEVISSQRRSALSYAKLVGEPLASHSRLVAIDDGLMMIEVDHAVYLQLFLLYKRKFLIKIKKTYPALNIFDMKATVVDKK